MTSKQPGKLLWIFIILLFSGPGVASAGEVSAGPTETRHDTSGVHNPGSIRRFAAPSGPYKPLTELGKGMLLVAGPHMLHPSFAQSVVLLVDVGEYGVLGLIINRATEYSLAEVIPALKDNANAVDLLYLGGPVVTESVSMLMQYEQARQDVHRVFGDVYFSTRFPELEANLKKPDHQRRLRVYAGQAGWAPGQLQDELKRGDWYLLGADAELVFNTEPESIWHQLIRSVSGLWVQNGSSQFPVVSQYP